MNPMWMVLGIVAVFLVMMAVAIWALWDLAMVWRWAIRTMFGD